MINVASFIAGIGAGLFLYKLIIMTLYDSWFSSVCDYCEMKAKKNKSSIEDDLYK